MGVSPLLRVGSRGSGNGDWNPRGVVRDRPTTAIAPRVMAGLQSVRMGGTLRTSWPILLNTYSAEARGSVVMHAAPLCFYRRRFTPSTTCKSPQLQAETLGCDRVPHCTGFCKYKCPNPLRMCGVRNCHYRTFDVVVSPAAFHAVSSASCHGRPGNSWHVAAPIDQLEQRSCHQGGNDRHHNHDAKKGLRDQTLFKADVEDDQFHQAAGIHE